MELSASHVLDKVDQVVLDRVTNFLKYSYVELDLPLAYLALEE